MFDRLARWLADFRPQILGVLSALTVGAAYSAVQILPASHAPPALPADPAITEAARNFEASFPERPMLTAVTIATPDARLDTGEGEAWLVGIEAAIRGTGSLSPAEAELGGPLAGDGQTTRRIAADGRTAVIEAPLRTNATPDIRGLSEHLQRLSAASGPGPRFRAYLLSPDTHRAGSFKAWLSSLAGQAVAAALLAAGLLAYSGSFTVTGLAIGAASLAIVWQVGLWSSLGGAFAPGMRYVPLLVFALTISHAFPMSRHIMRALALGAPPSEAAATVVQRMAVPGVAALTGVALALLAGAIPPVPALQATCLFAALGVFLVAPALFIALPLALTQFAVDRPPVDPEQLSRPRKAQRELPARLSATGPQTLAILSAALALVAALEAQGRLFGPIDIDAPRPSADALWSSDADAAAAGAGSPLASLSIVARTTPETCTRYDVLDAVDRLSWRLANIPGVSAVESLPLALRRMQADQHGGNPKWREIPRQPLSALQSMARMPAEAALFDGACRTLVTRVYAAPPIARVLADVDAAVARFRTENASSQVTFEMAGGPLAPALAEQRILARSESVIFLAVMTALAGAVFWGLRDWRAVPVMLMTGAAVWLAAGWTVAAAPIGLTSATLPLVLFALLLPVDMAAYVLAGWRAHRPDGVVELVHLRRALWQRDTRPFLARTISIVISFAVWVISEDALVSGTGLIAIVTTVTGTAVALWVAPEIMALIERGLEQRVKTA